VEHIGALVALSEVALCFEHASAVAQLGGGPPLVVHRVVKAVLRVEVIAGAHQVVLLERDALVAHLGAVHAARI